MRDIFPGRVGPGLSCLSPDPLDNMASYTSVHITPPLFEQGSVEVFKNSGRTLNLAFSPRDDSVAVFPTNNVRLDRKYAQEPLTLTLERQIHIS